MRINHGLIVPLFVAGCAVAVHAAETSDAVLQFSCRDSITGRGIRPDSLLLDAREIAPLADQHGRMTVTVAPGEHRLTVAANGYRALVARQTAVAAQTIDNALLLDPLAPDAEAQQNVLRAFADVDACVLSGYVIDHVTGQPVQDAEITVTEGRNQGITGEDGSFTLRIPLTSPTRVEDSGAVFTRTDLFITRTGYRTQHRQNVVLVSGGVIIQRFRLPSGEGIDVVDERAARGRLQATLVDGQAASFDNSPPPASREGVVPQAPQAAPASIRVGRNCPSKSTCTSIETMTMETYTKHVLPAEWFTSWRADSLKAGAIAIRSYGAWHVYNPLTATYDICDTTSCQVYKDTTAGSTNSAVDATAGIYVATAGGIIARAEYSAENNNSGTCGDCNTINNPSDSVCLSDTVCCREDTNGHGRGMCQWGTQRWALEGETWDWITDHYYAAYGWTRQTLAPAAPTITQQPTAQNVCPEASASFSIAATGTGTLTYRWQKDSVNLTNGGHYSGVATTTLTVSLAGAGDLGLYRCVVTGSAGNSTSDTAALTLRPATFVTQHPQGLSLCPGQTGSFTVIATGDGTLSYQWQKDGTALANTGHTSGVATATLTITGADSSDLGQYRCRVNAGCGLVNSNAAALTLDGSAAVPSDFDHDNDVDQADFGHLQFCMTGAYIPQTDPLCQDARLNSDTSVDSADFDLFLKCFSGAGIAPDPCCSAGE